MALSSPTVSATGVSDQNGAEAPEACSEACSEAGVGPSVAACTCTAPEIRRYLSRISGPLLDRIDIHIEVPRLSSEELMGKRAGESSACVRKRVVAARRRQTERMRGSGLACNAQLRERPPRLLRHGRGHQRLAPRRDCPVLPVG